MLLLLDMFSTGDKLSRNASLGLMSGLGGIPAGPNDCTCTAYAIVTLHPLRTVWISYSQSDMNAVHSRSPGRPPRPWKRSSRPSVPRTTSDPPLNFTGSVIRIVATRLSIGRGWISGAFPDGHTSSLSRTAVR